MWKIILFNWKICYILKQCVKLIKQRKFVQKSVVVLSYSFLSYRYKHNIPNLNSIDDLEEIVRVILDK